MLVALATLRFKGRWGQLNLLTLSEQSEQPLISDKVGITLSERSEQP